MWLKFIVVSLMLMLTIAINLPDSMIARVGFAPNILLATLVAMIIAGLVVHRHLMLIIVVVICAIGANLPFAIAEHLGINRDILFATLIGLVLMPLITGNIHRKE